MTGGVPRGAVAIIGLVATWHEAIFCDLHEATRALITPSARSRQVATFSAHASHSLTAPYSEPSSLSCAADALQVATKGRTVAREHFVESAPTAGVRSQRQGRRTPDVPAYRQSLAFFSCLCRQ
jgi:hypothetical protein